MKQEILVENIEKIHTTPMGVQRIKKNLNLERDDVVEYCKNIILNKKCNITKKGKNWYCEMDNLIITVNIYSYTIITAHKMDEKKVKFRSREG